MIDRCDFNVTSRWGNYARCCRPRGHAGDHRGRRKQWDQAGKEVAVTLDFRAAVVTKAARPATRAS